MMDKMQQEEEAMSKLQQAAARQKEKAETTTNDGKGKETEAPSSLSSKRPSKRNGNSNKKETPKDKSTTVATNNNASNEQPSDGSADAQPTTLPRATKGKRRASRTDASNTGATVKTKANLTPDVDRKYSGIGLCFRSSFSSLPFSPFFRPWHVQEAPRIIGILMSDANPFRTISPLFMH